jgi:hypothetical protein
VVTNIAMVTCAMLGLDTSRAEAVVSIRCAHLSYASWSLRTVRVNRWNDGEKSQFCESLTLHISWSHIDTRYLELLSYGDWCHGKIVLHKYFKTAPIVE